MNTLTPISFEFVAAGTGRRARGALARLKPSQVNKETPSWDRDGTAAGLSGNAPATVPITDPEYWEGRYVLTELILSKGHGDELVINDATVNISREKRITRTSLAGLDGTIKEYISNGDYDIDITVGIVAVDASGAITDEYPEEGIKKIKAFLDRNEAIEVWSKFFELFGISRMVVTRFSLVQETESNRQTINIHALSDTDYTIVDTEY